MMLIKLSNQDMKKCQDFANSIDTGFYATRNQFNAEKRIKDSIIGKAGEIACFNFFKLQGIEVSFPDFKIYDKSKKSWDHDLKNSQINIHVKTQNIEQSKKYGQSWIFENSDKSIFKEYADNDYVCFVIMDPKNQSAEIKAVLKLKDLHSKNIFKKPKLAYLTTKSAIYFDELSISFKNNLFDKSLK